MALKNAFQLWSARVSEKRSKVEWLCRVLNKKAAPGDWSPLTLGFIAAYFVFKSLFFALFWHLWLCWRASYFISDHLLLKNLLRTLVMKPAIPLRGMFCIFFTYIFVFGAQRLIIAFLSFSSCTQIKTSQQFFQSQLFCKQKNNIHVTCCGHCCFLAFHNLSHQTGLVISPERAHIELSHDLKHKL